jgi:hypothetical protein
MIMFCDSPFHDAIVPVFPVGLLTNYTLARRANIKDVPWKRRKGSVSELANLHWVS